MSYYTNLFLRPKEAVSFAYDHPSLLRSIGFILLGTLAGILASLLFTGSLFPDLILMSLIGDLLKWIIGGLLLVLLGLLWKVPVTKDGVLRALTMFAQLNYYGFFLFLILGIILPLIAVPGLLSATQQFSQGLIGEQEFNAAIFDALSSPEIPWLVIPFLLLAGILFLYMIYVLFLSVQKYLNTTVFKSVLAMIVLIGVQSVIVFILNGGL
ncbi:MAG: hypothetical protein Q8P05_01165 [Candidatus Diapherotrites archaeon]|nr:hypothetical protein [Candidatus Diapherotrites archaeon]